MNQETKPESLMDRAIQQFDQLLRDHDRFITLLPAATAVAFPSAVVWLVGRLTDLRGGAAIMKTLALAGGLVGEGATMGITVMGIGAVAAGWTVKRLIDGRRSSDRA